MREMYYGNSGVKVVIFCRGLNGMVKAHVVILCSVAPIINTITLIVFQL